MDTAEASLLILYCCYLLDGAVDFSIIVLVLPIALILLISYSYYYASGIGHSNQQDGKFACHICSQSATLYDVRLALVQAT